eukprot:9025152-Pyramimonas_sp.AAC.1
METRRHGRGAPSPSCSSWCPHRAHPPLGAGYSSSSHLFRTCFTRCGAPRRAARWSGRCSLASPRAPPQPAWAPPLASASTVRGSVPRREEKRRGPR